MKSILRLTLSAIAVTAIGCAGSLPPVNQRLADTELVEQSAKAVGADSSPAAKQEVTLAELELAQTKAFLARGDKKRADFVVMRARADADLALALAHERSLKARAPGAGQ